MNELRFFFFSPDGRRIGSFCSFGIKMATTIAKATINAPNTNIPNKKEMKVLHHIKWMGINNKISYLRQI